MRLIFRVIVIVLFIIGFSYTSIAKAAEEVSGSMNSDSKISVLEFIKGRSDAQLPKVPHKVMAFYYTWYGRPENHRRWVHWSDVKPDEHDIASSTHYPAKGAYDSHDPEIIDYHIQLAKDNGIDAFICTWWGQGTFDDRAFVKVLDAAEKKDFEVTVYWETAPGQGEEKIKRAVDDLVYILEKYVSHPAFLKVDGKPVIFVYGRIMGQVGLDEWPVIITRAQERYGKEFMLIADGYQESYARMFDGIHTYNICGWVQGKSREELDEFSAQSFKNAVNMARSRGKISCITIIPGYDDTKIRKPGINAKRMDGDTYNILWKQAINADPDWVLITSWNEWHEGSEIEPSWEDGDKYIKITGEYTKIFKKNEYSKVVPSKSATGLSPEKSKALRELYNGKSIGILPDFSSDAPFWLADAGLDIHELTWEDVVDPGKLNVKNFPVLVYASGEGYTQTLNKDNDVDKAIIRYLNDGGLVMALPSMPFPFFYNEKGEAVRSSGKLGFPIRGAWENPPEDIELTFEIDNKILGDLPKSVPFPKTGDLRWRPSSKDDISSGDIYLSLAKLKDGDGQYYGDGIVYVEHKASQPLNGKNIYAWMGMMDILNSDNLLYGIFYLAGEKMAK